MKPFLHNLSRILWRAIVARPKTSYFRKFFFSFFLNAVLLSIFSIFFSFIQSAFSCARSTTTESGTTNPSDSMVCDATHWVELDKDLSRGDWFDALMGAAGSKLEKALGDQFPEGERYFGLENFGNTCYCNSVLQVFITNPLLLILPISNSILLFGNFRLIN